MTKPAPINYRISFLTTSKKLSVVVAALEDKEVSDISVTARQRPGHAGLMGG